MTATLTREDHYSGPLPTPDHFAGFEKVLPGSAERILKMAELEQVHRHDLNVVAQMAFDRETSRGQWLAFFLAIITVVTGGVTAINGAQWTGSFIGTGGLIGLVTAFIVGRRKPATK